MARSRQPVTPGVDPNYLLQWVSQFRRARRAQREAADLVKLLKDRARAAMGGPELAGVLKALADADRDPELVRRGDAARLRAGTSLGFEFAPARQDDLFGPGGLKDTVMADFAEAQVEQEGYDAANTMTADDCPAQYVPGTPHFVAWHRGFALRRAFVERLDRAADEQRRAEPTGQDAPAKPGGRKGRRADLHLVTPEGTA